MVRTVDEVKKNPLLRHNIGKCYYELQDYENAIDNFEEAGASLIAMVSVEPELFQRNFYLLGHCQFKLEKYSFAKLSFKQANSFGTIKDKIVEMIDKCDAKLAAIDSESQAGHSTTAASQSEATADPQSESAYLT